MDGGTVTDPNLELSLRHLRDRRQEMAVWFALEVLQLDPFACEDEVLQDRLIACQERLEHKLRAKA
jgi:hypothetical protein